MKELKLLKSGGQVIRRYPFNRTMKELKLDETKGLRDLFRF